MAVTNGTKLLLLLAISHLPGLSIAASSSDATATFNTASLPQISQTPASSHKSSFASSRTISSASSQLSATSNSIARSSSIGSMSEGHALSKESAAGGPDTTDSSSSPSSTSSRATFDMSIPPSFTIFKTEPTFRPEFFDITHKPDNKALLAPGYIFLDPTFGPGTRGWGPWGPQIYTQDGELIWHGPKKMRSQNFHVCEYLGEKGNHLCLHERVPSPRWTPASKRFGVPSGVKYVMDNTYTIVSSNYSRGYHGFGTNGHEFNVVENGETFLQPVEVQKPMDLTPYGGKEDGWVKDVCFQEIDFKTKRKLFSWCWLDHLPIWDTSVFPRWRKARKAGNTTSAKGGRGTRNSPWDFAHINSIDKTNEGDYLMSARHCDQIVKIAGRKNVHNVKKGSVIWRLGGKGGDFEMDFSFSKQHAIRVISTGETESVISLLSNDMAGGVLVGENEVSSGQIIVVNNQTMKASLLRSYPQPFGLLTGGKGNLQLLENNNVFMGWGFLPSFSEFDYDGKLLYHVRFTSRMVQQEFAQKMARFEASYRAYKAPWVGLPKHKPKLLAYSRTAYSNRTSPLMAYVSWNGATEVKRWKFYIADTVHGPWYPVGTFAKHGFETQVQLTDFTESPYSFAPYVSVEGLDVQDKVLGQTLSKVFVPIRKIAGRCNDEGCKPERFLYPPELNRLNKGMIRDSRIPIWLPLALLVILVEVVNYLACMDWHSVFSYSRITDTETDEEGGNIQMLDEETEKDSKG